MDIQCTACKKNNELTWEDVRPREGENTYTCHECGHVFELAWSLGAAGVDSLSGKLDLGNEK